jgi:hypothetical protein
MLALAGGVADRSGLLWAGGITAGVGLIAVGPGVYMIVTSGSRTEVHSDRARASRPFELATPGLGLASRW